MKFSQSINFLFRYKFFILFVIILAVLTYEWQEFRVNVLDDTPSRIGTLVKGCVNISLLLLPFWWLKGRWRYMILIPWFLLTIFFISNLGYYRVYGHLMPLRSFLYVKNLDLTLINSLKVIFDTKDLGLFVAFLVSAIAIITTAFLRPKDHKIQSLKIEPVKIRWIATIMTITLYLLVETYVCISTVKENERLDMRQSISDILHDRYLSSNTCHNNITHNEDLVLYLAKAFVRECCQSQMIDKYTYEQQTEIESFFARQNNKMHPVSDIFLDNESKNLILIIVESLNSNLIDLHIGNGLEICPNLNRMAHDSTTVYIPRVISQVADGRSSDGQLLYNVGLLPLSKGAASMLCEKNKYLSLANLLHKDTSFEIICEKPSMWNHDITTRQFGFDELYTVNEDTAQCTGYDHAVFEVAVEKINKMRKSFYCQITTLSMHQPFTDVGSQANRSILIDDESMQPFVRKYLNACNYFDRELSWFLLSIEEEIIANSVIIIIGDHNIDFSPWIQSGSQDNVYIDSYPSVPMIIMNSGSGLKIDKTIGQCDVFPTILDIMNVTYIPGMWRGMGISAFNPTVFGAISSDGIDYQSSDSEWMQDAFTVSDLLLRGGGNIPHEE